MDGIAFEKFKRLQKSLNQLEVQISNSAIRWQVLQNLFGKFTVPGDNGPFYPCLVSPMGSHGCFIVLDSQSLVLEAKILFDLIAHNPYDLFLMLFLSGNENRQCNVFLAWNHSEFLTDPLKSIVQTAKRSAKIPITISVADADSIIWEVGSRVTRIKADLNFELEFTNSERMQLDHLKSPTISYSKYIEPQQLKGIPELQTTNECELNNIVPRDVATPIVPDHLSGKNTLKMIKSVLQHSPTPLSSDDIIEKILTIYCSDVSYAIKEEICKNIRVALSDHNIPKFLTKIGRGKIRLSQEWHSILSKYNTLSNDDIENEINQCCEINSRRMKKVCDILYVCFLHYDEEYLNPERLMELVQNYVESQTNTTLSPSKIRSYRRQVDKLSASIATQTHDGKYQLNN